jgi:hypothetical protein
MSLVDLRNELRSTPMPAGAPYAKKEFVESFLVRACDVMNIEHRDPDSWELEHLLVACGAILARMYNLALVNTEKAMAPLHERAEEHRDTAGAAPRRQLEEAIRAVRERPAPAA